MCKAGTCKNATGRSTPKIEHARTNYEIVPKSRANFEKILFRFSCGKSIYRGISKKTEKCCKIMKSA